MICTRGTAWLAPAWTGDGLIPAQPPNGMAEEAR